MNKPIDLATCCRLLVRAVTLMCWMGFYEIGCGTESEPDLEPDAKPVFGADATFSMDSTLPPSKPAPDASLDSSLDSSDRVTIDSSLNEAGLEEDCSSLNQRRITLIQRADCVQLDDCALIGSCGSAVWDGVSVDDSDEATHLRAVMVAKRCPTVTVFDGPIPHLECIDGHCKAVFETDFEGFPVGPWCGGDGDGWHSDSDASD